jgi:transposase
MVWKWVRKFNEDPDSVHDEPRSGRPSVLSDNLVRAVEAKAREDRPFRHCPCISRKIPTTVLYEIVTDRLDFRKLCSRWVLKMLSERHKKKRSARELTFLTQYTDGYLSQIVLGDET